ncbi:urease accessory protein UreH [Lysinibacillus yapensis]|uniref:Urease accessory protein UreH n=1 Tax=Ureibacillus yapensis TaxID=2304605 RepID=A0A396S791_9BACL|nr:LysE family transporter [Lysinibacillus yapensis]RHW36725.1 urease accessory protein UreH [Lysinibacillus yapensis]
MEITLLSVLALGFLLGIKHAIEPDHVIAVSTIASKSKKLWDASLAGVFWGIGHTATLFTLGIILILMKGDLSDKWSMTLEFLVGIMLVYLGITSLLSSKKNKQQAHLEEEHPENEQPEIDYLENKPVNKKEQSYLKSLFIGFVHGLAGSAAMVLLTMSTVNTVWQGSLYILIFGVGTTIGMLVFTTILGLPFVLSKKRLTLSRNLIMATAMISVLFGVYYMYNLGFNEGLFRLWM